MASSLVKYSPEIVLTLTLEEAKRLLEDADDPNGMYSQDLGDGPITAALRRAVADVTDFGEF